LSNEKRFRQIGYIICGLCLGAFLLYDCGRVDDYLFFFKYSAVTLGGVAILGAYMYKKMTAGRFVKIYKLFIMANVWIYVIYVFTEKVNYYLYKIYPNNTIFEIHYLLGAAIVIATFYLAYLYPRVKLLADFSVKILSISLYVIGIIYLAYLNTGLSPVGWMYLRAATPSIKITLIGTLVLAALSILSVLALRDLLKLIVTERKLGMEWYPFIISAYFVLVLTQNLIIQYNLAFSSAIISIIYALAALAWIIYGFSRRYSFIRKFGLGLAILSVIKLFLIDLAGLTQGYQILTYFSLGISLIAISFVYQYFSKRLELKEEVPADVEKGD
jgi:hypothetical protein